MLNISENEQLINHASATKNTPENEQLINHKHNETMMELQLAAARLAESINNHIKIEEVFEAELLSSLTDIADNIHKLAN